MSFLGGIAGALKGAGHWASNLLTGGDASGQIDPKLQHYDQASNQLGQIAANAATRAAPMAQAAQLGPAVQLATGQMDQSRQGVYGVANRLGAIANGQQAGAGELAVNRQIGQATAAQSAAAHAARGANAALGMRQAARNVMDIGQAGAGAAAQAQMQDQQAANQQLGQLYSGLYGQDANVAGQNAQLGQQVMLQQGQFGQQTALANQNAQLQQSQMNDATQIQALGQQMGWDQARINAEIQKSQAQSQDKGILGSLIQAGGAILGKHV